MPKPRSIFEDVSGQDVAAAPRGPSPGEAEARRRSDRRAISIWLFALAALVVVMVLVGGLTRLTDSGLSITEWKPVTGAVPPMSEAAWQEEFALYQATPEFQRINHQMTLSEFKEIYWWEWAHRQLGRLIGLVWALGFFWFLLRRRIPRGWTVRLLVPGLLGAMQGAIGWWMVASGLVNGRVDVASYRLATHLGLAFAIIGVLLHLAWEVRLDGPAQIQARRRRLPGAMTASTWLAALVFLQLILGALVAGIDAGTYYIDWPLMAGDFLPPESFDYVPLWTNAFENPALVQFNHRILAYILIVAGAVWWLRQRRLPHAGLRRRAHHVLAMLFVQVLIGIATVMNAAPLHWAILHQAGAILLWTLVLRARFEAGWPIEERIARGRLAGS